MNYYPFHIGDYAKDAGHLSMLEDGAYRRLMDFYYTTEKPLPLDKSELYRRVRAKSSADKQAVDTVLKEFFKETPEGWWSKRCDDEVKKVQRKAEAARNNGKKGGRPVTQEEPNDNPVGLQKEPNEKLPITNNQEPITKEEKTVSANADLRSQAIEILNFLNSKTGRSFKPVDETLKPIIARLRKFPADDLRAVVVAKCREWLGNSKMEHCLRPKTLFGAENFANYEGQLATVSNENVI